MEDALPFYMHIGKSFGLTVSVFMDSCPVDLKPYIGAHKFELEEQNRMFHVQGLYVRDAIMSSIGNSGWFRGKGHPAHEYPKDPYPLFDGKRELTEQEKRSEVDKFYAQESIRRANWKRTHNKKNNQGKGEP